MNCARELEIAKALAAQAGAALMQFRSATAGDVGHTRASGELISVAGLVADDLICSGLADAFPDDSLSSRHSGQQAGWTGRVWLVDSLDNDANFIAGGDQFTICIGLALHGKAVLGVVFNPSRKEMFAGAIKLGATLNGNPIGQQASSENGPEAIVVPEAEWPNASTLCQGRLPLVPFPNLSYALARVAAGLEAGMISLQENRGCTTCSAAALVEAAGARVTLLDGSDIFYRSDEMAHPKGIVAAAAFRHAQLLSTLRSLLADDTNGGAGPLRDVA